MLTSLRRALVAAFTTAVASLGLGMTPAAQASGLTVVAFGAGDGRVAIALGANETYDAGHGADLEHPRSAA